MSLCATVSVISKSLSAMVDFPWSMCAMMEKFRILSGGTTKTPSTSDDFPFFFFSMPVPPSESLLLALFAGGCDTALFLTKVVVVIPRRDASVSRLCRCRCLLLSAAITALFLLLLLLLLLPLVEHAQELFAFVARDLVVIILCLSLLRRRRLLREWFLSQKRGVK
jgi:hypothetical protein